MDAASGVVTGVAAGTAVITATCDGRTATATINVRPRPTASWNQTADWATYQGNASHTGYVDATLDPVSFRERWVTSVAAGVVLNPVTEGGGSVFALVQSYFGAQKAAVLDAATGAVRWSHDFGNIHGVHPPSYANGRMYLTTSGHEDSFLWSFDAGTGAVLFRSAYGNQWSTYYAPVVLDGSVSMAGGSYGGMYRFGASDRAQQWFAGTNQYDGWTPAVRDGIVYAYTGSYSPKVSAVKPGLARSRSKSPTQVSAGTGGR